MNLEYIKKQIIYCASAVLIGLIVGAIDALFGRVLIAITGFRGGHVPYLVPFLGIAGLLILFLYKRVSEKALGGMGLVFDTGFQVNDEIPLWLVPLIMVTTWMTHLFGGSAGREGVAVQIGATVSHAIGKIFHAENNARIYLIMGMAAGFGGLFQTPLAATFFALEVLVAGSLIYESLLPCLIAAFVSSNTSSFLGLEKFFVNVTDTLNFTPQTAGKVILIAVIFGIVGGAFAHCLGGAKKLFAKWIPNGYARIFGIGIGLSVVLLILHMGRYCGLGTNLITASFTGDTVYGYDFILKFILTIITLAAGYQGGEVTPLFSIGASLGVVLAGVFGLPVMLIAALGYAAVFGSATNTLLAPIFIGVEVFGPQNVIYFAIVCAIAYAINGNKTIYGKQRENGHQELEG